jgi:pyruvate/2-oxoacid:ferredoxin oxidoreductase alpha subunit
MGQMTGKVDLPPNFIKPGIPDWAVYGDASHRGNLISSIQLSETDLQAHNIYLNQKYARMIQNEQRAEQYRCDDAEILLIACNTPARMAKGAVQEMRHRGVRAGLFRPITLWPFPIDFLRPIIPRIKKIVMVEAGNGQLEDELRLALSKSGIPCPPLESVRHFGGVLPQKEEIIEQVASEEVYV